MIPILQEKDVWAPIAIVLGKGPSAVHREKLFRRFPRAILVTLNHAIRWADARSMVWAHFVDIEAMEECWSDVRDKATHLLIPTVMNRGSHRFKGKKPIPLCFPPSVISYDRDEAGLRFFSVEGALGALGVRGLKYVLLCGIDGGNAYAPGLEDVAHRRLENGRGSYDIQWGQLQLIAEKFKMEVRRVAMEG